MKKIDLFGVLALTISFSFCAGSIFGAKTTERRLAPAEVTSMPSPVPTKEPHWRVLFGTSDAVEGTLNQLSDRYVPTNFAGAPGEVAILLEHIDEAGTHATPSMEGGRPGSQ